MRLGLHSAFVLLTVALVQTAPPAHAVTVRVGDGEQHTTIAAGLSAAHAGDTVIVYGGVYLEHDIIVGESITLLGQGKPVIDASEAGEILTITADNVFVSGFVLQNVGTSFMKDRAAIRLVEVANCTIDNNVIINGFFGVYGENAENCVIRGNTLRGSAERESTSGNGVHLWYCRGITVTGNTITGHRDGIYFEFVDDSQVIDNTSEANLRYGLHFMFSNHDSYENNRFARNGAGVAVMYSSNVDMHYNRFEHNWGVAAFGLLLKEIKDSTIEDNVFFRNTIALYAEGSNRISVRHNEFIDNGYAAKVMANCNDNLFSENNFIGNQFDVTTNSRQNFNVFSSNYWSDYGGYDLDRDGIGDVPHHPVRLYALLVEKQPPGIILMHSLFVRLIDTAERVMPVFTPETLSDNSPRMSVYPSKQELR